MPADRLVTMVLKEIRIHLHTRIIFFKKESGLSLADYVLPPGEQADNFFTELLPSHLVDEAISLNNTIWMVNKDAKAIRHYLGKVCCRVTTYPQLRHYIPEALFIKMYGAYANTNTDKLPDVEPDQEMIRKMVYYMTIGPLLGIGT